MRNPLLLKEASFFVISVLAFVPFLNAKYLDEAIVLWSYQLPGLGTLAGPGLRKNNAVIATEKYLFTTTDEGSLHLIPVSGDDEKHVEAPTLFGASTECQSGVSISYDDNEDINFVVYAVHFSINMPNFASEVDHDEKTSRVVAVNIDGTIRWTHDFSGSIAGTPVASKNFIYISVSNKIGGKIVILQDQGTSKPVVAAEISPERTQFQRPFGPLTIQVSSTGQNYLFWGDSTHDGQPEENHYVYTLYPSSEFDTNQGLGTESYTLKRFGVWNKTSITKPVVARDLSAIWMGGSDSAVSGWVDGLEMTGLTDPASFNWQNIMIKPEMNPRQPMSTTMTISSDGEFIFLTDNKVSLHCIQAKTGEIVWSNDGDTESGYMVQPILSERPGENSIVYTIETMRGNVRQHDASTGEIIWEFNCYDLSRTQLCQHSVEAEFSLSPDGNVLYFGDIFGKITALRVANFDSSVVSVTGTPTVAPTIIPITSLTGTPTAASTVSSTTPAPEELSSTITLPISTTLGPTFESPTTLDQGGPSEHVHLPSLERRPSSQPSKYQFQPISPLDNASNGLSSSENLNSSTGPDKNSILLIALIVIFIGCAFVALAFFFLILKKRRQEKIDRDIVIKKKSSETMDAEVQPEESSNSNIASLVVINRRVPDLSTPKKRKNKKVIKTPATLESIEETPEDVSVVSSVNEGDTRSQNNKDNLAPTLLSLEMLSDPACNKKELDTSQNNNAGVTNTYLPKALSHTFDQVLKNVLDIGVISTKEDEVRDRCGSPVLRTESSDQTRNFPELVRIPSPPVALGGPTDSAPDSPPPPPAPSYAPAPEMVLPPFIDDTNSIGSGSLFIEDDMAGNSISPRSLSPHPSQEESSGVLPKEQTAEDLSIKHHDPWNKFMSSIIDAEQEFFNPTLPATSKHKTKPEGLQDTPFDERKD